MAVTKGKQADLKFEPSVDEQLLLPQIKSKNIMLSYQKESNLMRVITLLILLKISQEISNALIPRILFLTRRNSQDQVKKSLNELIEQTVTIHNGGILPIARKQDYNRFSIIISTPKTVKNDLKEEFFPGNHFSLVLFDYAEMGASSSSLRYLADHLKEAQFVGISQEQNADKIQQACINLKLKEMIRVENEEHNINRANVQHISFPLPKEYWLVLNLLDRIKTNEIRHFEQLGFSVSAKSTRREIAAIHASIVKEQNGPLMIKTANLQRIMNLQKIVVSEGFPSVIAYFTKLHERLEERQYFEGRKSIQFFLKHPVIQKLQEFLSMVGDLEHPKVRLVLDLVNKYNTGVSIVTNNNSNAEYLYKYLQEQGIKTILLKKPITAFSHINLEKRLFTYTSEKTQVCISNSANQLIADNSKIIIAYDVSGDIIRSLDDLNTSIVRVFLIAKQTADDTRFNYFKNFGSTNSSNKSNFNNVNQALRRNDYGNDIKDNNNSKLNPKYSIHMSPDLYESEIPYLFNERDFKRGVDPNFLFSGIEINNKCFFIVISPETINSYDFSKLSTNIDQLRQNYINIRVLIYPQTLNTLKLEYRNNILEIFQNKGILATLVKSNQEIFNFAKSFLEKL